MNEIRVLVDTPKDISYIVQLLRNNGYNLLERLSPHVEKLVISVNMDFKAFYPVYNYTSYDMSADDFVDLFL